LQRSENGWVIKKGRDRQRCKAHCRKHQWRGRWLENANVLSGRAKQKKTNTQGNAKKTNYIRGDRVYWEQSSAKCWGWENRAGLGPGKGLNGRSKLGEKNTECRAADRKKHERTPFGGQNQRNQEGEETSKEKKAKIKDPRPTQTHRQKRGEQDHAHLIKCSKGE